MATIRGPARAICTLGSALLILTGCDKLAQDDSQWARAALERNPDLTIVASDKDAHTFTVQVKGSSELRVVHADQIIGAVPSTGAAEPATERSEPVQAAPASEPTPAAESPTPSQTTASVGEPARAPASTQNVGIESGKGVIRDAVTGRVLASTDSAVESPSASTASVAPGATLATASSGKVLASGPGYTVSAGERVNRPIRLAEASELKSPVNAALERRYEPMICQGNRLLHIDGRNLEFEGDALSALDGCEIHITNSHIIAHGMGITARAANVHIKNSIIEGDAGSVSASEGAKIYTQQSTFKGLSRRLDSATFQDLGGTHWN